MKTASMTAAIHRSWWLPAAISAFAALILFKQFGVGWDDPLQTQYGDSLLAYYASGGVDRGFEELADLRFYGGAFEIPAQLATRISPWSVIETRRLLGGLVGALGVLGCGALGGLLAGPGGAWISGLLLATWPAWVGHAFINSKDVPFATAFVWSVFFLARLARRGSSATAADHVSFAVSCGLAIGTRAGGLILIAAYGLVFLRAILSLVRSRAGDAARSPAAVLLPYLVGAGVAWGIMMLAWPWTQDAPLSRPFEAAHIMSRFPRPMEVLFKGQSIVTRRLPWDYAPTWFAITLPPLVVCLLACAIPVAAFVALRRGRRPDVAAVLVTSLAVIPLATVMSGRGVLYDGIRQILFVAPILVALAAWTMVQILDACASARLRAGLVALASVLFLDPLAALVRLHPYQYIYFNAFVGGLRGAAGRFETDYWALSMREAAEWVNRNQALLKSKGALKVHVPHNCGEPTSVGAYLDPAIRLTDNNLAANIVIAPTRFGCHTRLGGTPVFRVERDGVVLSVVKELE